jgi:putative ABC transport system permease protein
LRNRTGALVGRALADRFGWKVGDRVPLMSNIFRQSNGSNSWDLTVEGIYDNQREGGENASLFLHYTYFNEGIGEMMADSIGWVVFRIDDADRAEEIAARVDALFANSPTETKTSTEQAFAQGFANQLGNVGAIITAVAFAVFFTMLLVTANTMAQSVRERTNELAVMKTLGFSSRSVMLLVLCESVFITALGGLIGLGLSALVIAGVAAQMQQFMPFSGLPASAYGSGLVLIVMLGLLAGALPCAQAFRLRITEALRRG